MHDFYYFSVSLLRLSVPYAHKLYSIFPTRDTHQREEEREREKGEERKREMGRRKWERTTKNRTSLSLIHFTVCHSQNSFIFRSRGSLNFSTLNKSRSTHKRCSHYSTAITSFGLHACVTEGRESRSFFALLTISIQSNLQKSTNFDCGLRSWCD